MTTLQRSFRWSGVDVRLRYLSNILFLSGYFVLLNVDPHIGLSVKVFANAILYPWLIKNKIWDGLTVISIMTAIDIHKLIAIITTNH